MINNGTMNLACYFYFYFLNLYIDSSTKWLPVKAREIMELGSLLG